MQRKTTLCNAIQSPFAMHRRRKEREIAHEHKKRKVPAGRYISNEYMQEHAEMCRTAAGLTCRSGAKSTQHSYWAEDRRRVCPEALGCHICSDIRGLDRCTEQARNATARCIQCRISLSNCLQHTSRLSILRTSGSAILAQAVSDPFSR